MPKTPNRSTPLGLFTINCLLTILECHGNAQYLEMELYITQIHITIDAAGKITRGR